MADSIRQVVEGFLADKASLYPYPKNIKKAENLLKKSKKFAFLSREAIKSVIDKPINHPGVPEAISAAIKESVMSYTKEKDIAIDIFKRFINFISREYQVNIPIVFPPVFSSDFDRQMYIVKELHEKGLDVA